jgi:hypothetical protein
MVGPSAETMEIRELTARMNSLEQTVYGRLGRVDDTLSQVYNSSNAATITVNALDQYVRNPAVVSQPGVSSVPTVSREQYDRVVSGTLDHFSTLTYEFRELMSYQNAGTLSKNDFRKFNELLIKAQGFVESESRLGGSDKGSDNVSK